MSVSFLLLSFGVEGKDRMGQNGAETSPCFAGKNISCEVWTSYWVHRRAPVSGMMMCPSLPREAVMTPGWNLLPTQPGSWADRWVLRKARCSCGKWLSLAFAVCFPTCDRAVLTHSREHVMMVTLTASEVIHLWKRNRYERISYKKDKNGKILEEK